MDLAYPHHQGADGRSAEGTMKLIVFYIAFVIAGDFADYLLGLFVEYEWGSNVSLIVFLLLYFFFLWVSWPLAVWMTKPRGAASRVAS
jgi:hypothetical protein